MKRIMILLLFCTMLQAANSQRVSRNYKDKSMSKVLIDLRRSTNRYKIAFIHNELEDYTVTKQFDGLTIPEAIQECIGYYPITMKNVGDSLIFVEAMLKTEGKLIGRLVDTKKHPVVYANIALLNVGDSAIVSSGVSNENGDFVIPTTERQLRIRISCITSRQRLFYEARFSFGRNSYDNTYQESDGYDITSHTKEKTFGIYGTVGYVNNVT